MKDFITIDIDSDFDRYKIFEKMSSSLKDYQWKTGGGDYQDSYVSGIGDNVGQIKIWITKPVEVSISFRFISDEMKGEWQSRQFEIIKKSLSELGKISRIKYYD